jgi:hypothetical protein
VVIWRLELGRDMVLCLWLVVEGFAEREYGATKKLIVGVGVRVGDGMKNPLEHEIIGQCSKEWTFLGSFMKL